MMKNKIVVITGASSGIGLATAELFAKNDYRVYGISHTFPEKSIENVFHLQGDVTSSGILKVHFETIYKKEGKIDTVICNAGIGVSGASEFIEKEKSQKQIDVNLLGAIETARVAVPFLKKGGGGKILFTSSVAAIIPLPFQAGYSASKAGINLYSQALRMELARFGIKVSAVMPGDTKTSFTKSRDKVEEQNTYSGKVGKSVKRMEKDEQGGKNPNSVAKVFLKLAKKKSPKPLVCVGFSYKAISVLAKILPQRAMLFIVKKLYGWKIKI